MTNLDKEECCYCGGTGKIRVKCKDNTFKTEFCLGCNGIGIRVRLSKEFKEDLK